MRSSSVLLIYLFILFIYVCILFKAKWALWYMENSQFTHIFQLASWSCGAFTVVRQFVFMCFEEVALEGDLKGVKSSLILLVSPMLATSDLCEKRQEDGGKTWKVDWHDVFGWLMTRLYATYWNICRVFTVHAGNSGRERPVFKILVLLWWKTWFKWIAVGRTWYFNCQK